MKYEKVGSSSADLTILNDPNDTQRSPPSLVQQVKVWENKLFSKYRLFLFALLFILLICLMILFTIFIYRNQRCRTSNSSVLTKSSMCNQMNGTVINNNASRGGCEHFTRVANWDYPHNDMLRTVVNEYETCCSMCWHQASCMLFAYSPTTKDCWIKTKITEDGGYIHLDRISGVLSECTEGTSLDNWDYPGNNIFENEMNGSIPASTWRTCCGLCLRQIFCTAYTFSPISHQCWLKTKASNGRFDLEKISGRTN